MKCLLNEENERIRKRQPLILWVRPWSSKQVQIKNLILRENVCILFYLSITIYFQKFQTLKHRKCKVFCMEMKQFAKYPNITRNLTLITCHLKWITACEF